MSRVYRAHHEDLVHKRCAIEVRQRFAREAGPPHHGQRRQRAGRGLPGSAAPPCAASTYELVLHLGLAGAL